jgi:Domain of unknown function (DUF397)
MNRADVTAARKPRRSTVEGNCVTIGQAPALIVVFDSKQDATGPVLTVTSAAWAAFLAALR